MKRLLATFGVFALLGFVIGKLTNRPPATTKASSAPPIVHVQLDPPADKPLEGRFKPFRRWLTTYRDILDPALVLTVAVIAALATAGFAWWTNSINEQQGKLLLQQNEIQASQALPVFQFSYEREQNNSGEDETEWLMVSNTGGTARNYTINVFPGVTVTWRDRDGHSATARDIPIDNFGYLDTSIFYPEHLEDEPMRFGYAGNLRECNDFIEKMLPILGDKTGAVEIDITRKWHILIWYEDFQGNPRFEFYQYSTGLEGSHDRSYSMSTPEGFQKQDIWNARYDEGLVITPSLAEDETWLNNFVSGLVEDGQGSTLPPDAPPAQPLSLV